MSCVRESNLYRLWLTVCAVYLDSALHRLLAGAVDWCGRQMDQSAFLRVACREGALARGWGASLLCRALTAAVNFPGWLLHRLYLALQPLFDGSFFANLAFEMGEETAVAESWLVLALWVIPFAYWVNGYTLIGFGLLLALFYVRSMRSARARLDLRAVGFYPLVLFGAVCLAVPLSAYPALSARFLMYHGACALCVVVTVSAVRRFSDLQRLAMGAGAAVLVTSLYGVYQRIQGVEVNKSYVDLTLNAGMPGRVQSIFDNPNTFAEVLILLLPLVAALFLTARHWLVRLAAAGTFAAGAAALGMTYSRASWIGLAAAMVVFVFLWKPKLFPVFVLACILCAPLLPQSIWNRILTIANPADSSTSSRIPLYQAALATIRQSPLFGAGLGVDAVQTYIADHNLYHAEAPFVHAHNIYLEVWIEAGLLGVSAFAASMLWNIKNAARAARRCAQTPSRVYACACAASLCGAMVTGLADYLWHYPRVMGIFWFVFALGAVSVRLCAEESCPGQQPSRR